jgi:Na+/H+-dicarboxylate symporter
MLIIVLNSIGLPVEGLALILAIDRPLDMLRTVLNVTGDAMIATIVAKTEREIEYVPGMIEKDDKSL